AELFARTMQLQKRALVIGDRSAGDVMAARVFTHGFQSRPSDEWYFSMYYGAEITIGDCVMPDLQTLEHFGVIPDEIVLPSQKDLAAGDDRVLARAVELAGGHLSPKE